MYTLQILTHIQNSRQVFGFLHFQAQLMDMLGKILQEITICLSNLKKSHSSGNWATGSLLASLLGTSFNISCIISAFEEFCKQF